VKPNIFTQATGFGSFDPKIFFDATVIGRTVVSVRKDENIFSRGDDARFVAQLKKGSVALATPSGNKTAPFISIFGKGDFIGEECLTGVPRRKGTACARTPTILLIVKKKDFLQLLRDRPELSHHFIAYLLTRSVQIEKRLVDAALRSLTDGCSADAHLPASDVRIHRN
jgi:CRP/FNR family cyclic AMP-dependent transcriptional regulator